MNIVLVAHSLAPLPDNGERGAAVAALAAKLKRPDNEVHVIVPMTPAIDPAAHSLAKRLRPIEVSASGARGSWFRFDGRTPSGLEAHVLQANGPAPIDSTSFCAAAGALATSLAGEGGLCCVSLGTDLASVLEDNPCVDCAPRATRIVILDTPKPPTASLDGAAAVLVLGQTTARAISRRPDHPVAAMLDSGAAMVLPMAAPIAAPSTPSGRLAKKASLQLALGLPVRVDVPLFLFPARGEELLRVFLRGDVQAIAPADPGSDALDDLQARYPDRLALGRSDHGWETLLRACDFCVSFDPERTLAAASAGTVPVVSPDGAEGVVDLEPSLESGTALVAEASSRDGMLEALGRATAVFDKGPAFTALSARLPSLFTDARGQARMLLDLIERATAARAR